MKKETERWVLRGHRLLTPWTALGRGAPSCLCHKGLSPDPRMHTGGESSVLNPACTSGALQGKQFLFLADAAALQQLKVLPLLIQTLNGLWNKHLRQCSV